jgi:patatin-like phospholipase/acyl hydrolase
MRRKLTLLFATALAGGMIAVGPASPASANHCDPLFSTDDPVILFTCRVVDSAPEPGPTINHYYWLAFDTVHYAYCTASPSC